MTDPSAPSIPHSRQAEEATIGAVLINPEAYCDLSQFLRAGDFYIHRHKWIWEAFAALHDHGTPIDILTLTDELERQGQLKEIGGQAFLTALTNQTLTSLNAESYGRIIQAHALRRRMVAAANAIANDANDEKIDPGELKGRALDVIETQAGPAAWQRFVMRAATYAMEPQPPVDYVVEKLVTNSSVDVFFGEPGSKKTYSALSLAVCVANGKPWLGFATRQSPVLYLDEESGERRFTRRLGEALRGELCDEHSPIHYVCLASFKLDTSADPVIIQGLIEGVGARLVIFDALADLMDGDENDKADVQPVFNHLRKIAEATDSAVMVIHHAGKSGGYRGSSAIKGAVDLMVQIGSENGSNFVNFHSEKNRDGDKMSWAAEAVWTTDQFYLRAVDVREKTKPVSKSPEYVLRFLKKHGASAIPDIMAGADTCGAEGARKAVYSLADLKMLYRTNPGETGQGKAAIYDLTRTRPND